MTIEEKVNFEETNTLKRYRNTKIMFFILLVAFLILIVTAWAALREEKYIQRQIEELGCRGWLEERINYNYQDFLNKTERFFPTININNSEGEKNVLPI